MYAPYIRDGRSSDRDRNAASCDAGIVHNNWIDRLPRGWWFAPLFVAGCGVAGWFATLPLG